ncbi:integral membrane protein GPR155 [Orussus abietinus]|uniref:integral membrane protein GPR155 n=1 Tax=Orussus abietinus TaxID=222816 RepID=UPI0006260243|nr:integral membrane protein GPR155 [Orussus abietinus]
MDLNEKRESSPTDNLYLALIQCFGVIICGYIAGRLGVVTKAGATGLNTFVGTFALPSLIFLSLAKLDFSTVNWKFLLAVLLSKSFVFFAVLIISMIISKSSKLGRCALFSIFTTQSNDFAIGYPMIEALYAGTHPEYAAYLYLMAPVSLAILNPVGFVLLEVEKRRAASSGPPLLPAIAKGVALNPVLAMTVLGIVGNLALGHEVPRALEVVLDVFGNAFSASALFLLGLMMVGKVHTLRGAALLIPGVLISVKLLVLPLTIRETVVLLAAGANANETADLATYGFLYGTIPTAPALFVFSLRYGVDVDLLASAMVACTFLSAPLMFVSAKLIDAVRAGASAQTYAKELSSFLLDTSAASVTACIWLFICFAARRRTGPTHRCTLCMLLSQLVAAVGVILWTKLDPLRIPVGSALWYIQFILITGGTYATRAYTAALAVTLLFLSSRSTSFIRKVHTWVLPTCLGGPLLLVGLMCILLDPEELVDVTRKNPNFQLGKIEAAVSVLFLIFCLLVTLGCLILQQRYERRHHPVMEDDLASPVTDSETTRSVVDVEDIVPTSSNLTVDDCSVNGCRTTCCSNVDRGDCEEASLITGENEILEAQDPQTRRHVVLLILLLCSMFIGLSLSINTLVTEQMTGIYAELSFLDAALNFGQPLIVFAIFGLDPGFLNLLRWLHQLVQTWTKARGLDLPDEDSLSIEVKTVRDEFNRCHLAQCHAQIAFCRRRLLRIYRGVFAGKDLVDWLLEAGLSKDREEAVHYGQCLLNGRVLRHIDGTQHFQDKNLLYTFEA